jgi:hypothetical protein
MRMVVVPPIDVSFKVINSVPKIATFPYIVMPAARDLWAAGIHVAASRDPSTWMTGTSPVMTIEGVTPSAPVCQMSLRGGEAAPVVWRSRQGETGQSSMAAVARMLPLRMLPFWIASLRSQ